MPWATSAQSVLDFFLLRPPSANWWAGFIASFSHLLHAIFRRCDFANAAIAASRVGS
jgi:hypothetical protein